MDDDPFDSIAQECQTNLTKLSQNIKKWTDSIQPLITSNKLKTSKKNELLLEYSSFQTDMKNLEWEIAELDEVNKEVKSDPSAYNLLENDVFVRQNKIEQMFLKLNGLRKDFDSLDLKQKLETPNQETPLSRFESGQNGNSGGKSSGHHSALDIEDDGYRENSHSNRKVDWSAPQKQIIKEQDNQLDKIGESVNALKNMSYSIGEELEHQSNLLDDLGTDMSHAASKTDQVMKRLAQVTHLDTDKRQWWAILYLGLAIVFLLFLNIIW